MICRERASLRVVVVLASGPAVLATWPAVSQAALDNPIVVENAKPGNPRSEWDVDPSERSIEGYTTDISYNKGQQVRFKVATDAPEFLVRIYRVGYYGGLGARLVATATGTGANQPQCLREAGTGLVDCGNWSVNATWQIPPTATSGVYLAKLIRPDTGAANHAVFVVRDDARHADVLVQTSDTTWQSYNNYGGNNLYFGETVERAYKVSYNRPFRWRLGPTHSGISNPFQAEFPMIRWLEANGYDVGYFAGVDTDRFGSLIQNHKAFLSVGHDEYWSKQQRENVEAAQAAGVNLAFFSGNEVFWKVRWENSIDGSGTPYRTLPVCYKETHAGGAIDPEDPPVWTGTWRDPRFSPPADGGSPENALTGTLFTVNGLQFNDLVVSAEHGKMRLWRNTGLESLPMFGSATLGKSLLGFEWDEDVDNGYRPRGLIRLSSTTAEVAGRLLDYGSSYAPGPATHSLTLYRHASGALVFGAGTIQWSWGLDADHPNNAGAPVGPADVRVQQATVNLLADMGIQPGSLQPALQPASASSDSLPPTTEVAWPAPGTALERGAVVSITGTASDQAPGVVGGVEVSVDGGDTWHPASGRENWSYPWVPDTVGPARVLVAAVDDSGNLQSPGTAVDLVIVPSSGPNRIWSNADVPAVASANDDNPVELGVKFIADTTGDVTGIRFYKGAGNNDPHFGHLWRGDGTLLATATFENETAVGWQHAQFPSPVPIRANTTYVASYYAPQGHYAYNMNYFANAGVDSPPLHALRHGVDGPNGIYAYGGSGFPLFPSSSFVATNYWVDVDFTPTIPERNNTTLWASTDVPAIVAAPDAAAVELGTRFQTDEPGVITAIRYYKSAENTGTHLGNLWTGTGTLLASTVFTNETEVGWQQANLAEPLPVSANVPYVVSYHTNAGFYSASLGYFASNPLESPPLYAPRDTPAAANGVYRYGASGFPTATYLSTAYFVDVVFQPNRASAAALTTLAAGGRVREDARPRKLSKLKYAASAWRRTDAEAWSPLKPRARGLLNGGKLISKEGR